MWKTVKLEDIADVKAGNPAPQDKNLFENGVYPFVRTSDVGKVKVGSLSDANDKLNQQGIAKLKLFPKGTILFPKSGASTFLNHRVILEMDAYVASHLATIKSKQDDVSDKYLWYFLQTIDAADLVADSAYPSLNTKTIQSISVPLPPIAEQERIVAKLDAAFAEIDEAINIINKNISSYSNLSLGIMREVLNNNSYQWEIKNLSSLSENLDSKRVPITKSKRIAGNVPYYGASGIVDYVKEFIFDDDLLLISEDGANLLTRSYPIAFSISGKSWVNNHAHVLKFKSLQLQEWVELYLNSTNLSPYISGMAQPKLNQKKLNEIPIPCPHSEMLDELLNMVASTKKNIEEILVVEAKKIKELMKLKSAILAQELQPSEAA